MSNGTLLPILLLYTNNREAIEGTTRFQKLVFLAQEEGGLSSKYAYHAEKFGPFSYDLADELDRYVKEGYIERDTEPNAVGHEKHIYSLTTDGQQVARRAAQKQAYRPILEILADIKSAHNETPLQELLRYVYTKYDEYTTGTELDLDTLFDPDARSQFLEPGDDEPDFLGAGPEKALEKNSSAKDLFSLE